MLPTVTFDTNKNYTFTLWRDGKELVYSFKDVSLVGIHGIDERVIHPTDRVKINGPACSGVFYYI